MFKWIKEVLFGSGDFMGNGSFPLVRTPPMPKVKPTKGKNISEPIISFVNFVRNNRKRFIIDRNTSLPGHGQGSKPLDYRMNDNKAYRIYDKYTQEGWLVEGRYYSMFTPLGWYHEDLDKLSVYFYLY